MLSRRILLYLSKQKKMAEKITRIGIFGRMARRFVAGETIPEAIETIKKLNELNILATFDHLGENVTTKDQALASANEYLVILDEIEKSGANANVSLKLTQMGLDVDPKICYENVERIVNKAKQYKNFVRIDMESSNYTDLTLDIFTRIRKQYDNVGIVIQASLFRSNKDIDDIFKINGRVRLCKGAYLEPSTIAFKKKKDTDANYIELTKKLLLNNEYHAIATHDEKMIQATINFAKEKSIPNNRFEFQMLYGIRRDRQLELAKAGYIMRVYVPYGKEWYPYFMRRLGERPANVFFILRYMFS